METHYRRSTLLVIAGLLIGIAMISAMPSPAVSEIEEVAFPAEVPTERIAAVISCKGMIDDALYQSIKRRTQEALDQGATYIIYEISTYGGLVKTADDISKYFILDVGTKEDIHTVAYVTTEAISAGSLISVACKDIIMLENTTIGDCAPIIMGGTLEGVEREKTESFIRAIFSRSAEANGYPEALLRAMVTQRLEVFRVKNINTGEYEFFDSEDMPKDETLYDLENKQIAAKKDELLTLTASKALEYGIARATVDNLDQALGFLEERDGIQFADRPIEYPMLWSENMVRWINSPAVMGVLVMAALLGGYIELNSPGLGLPGLVAVICLVIIVGSKYIHGLANWVEIVIFAVGIILLLVEIFVIPGFGIAGTLGIMCLVIGGFGMLIKNAPDELPWPKPEFGGWAPILDSLVGVSLGFVGFVMVAIIFAKYLPKITFLNGLAIQPAPKGPTLPVSMTTASPKDAGLQVGQSGIAVSILRPVGQGQFDDAIADVVAEGEFIQKGDAIVITGIHGNRVVVRKA